MRQPSLITIFLFAIAVVIGVEFFYDDFVSSDANVPEEQNTQDSQANTFGEVTLNAPLSLDLSAGEDLGENAATEQQLAPSLQVKANIVFDMVGRAGFKNVTLQRIPFNGIMFERIDLRDFKSVPVVKQNLLQNNKTIIATFYEFHAKTEPLANEIYSFIKDRAAGPIEAEINQTNDYGSASFFINYSDKKNDAFLIVKKGTSVYAYSYPKGSHSLIESLIKLIKQ
ncbi:hypothetical protein GF340_01040 [Candidatus Peregrinibacteria bacterium]|nr:hypothetical protein [Candidatus Peregrinibacteria bacterium]